MERIVYLLNVSITGVKNIEKEIKIDFYGKLVNKGFNPKKNKIKAIYGENGCGKTAIISAVQIVKDFIINEDYLRVPNNQVLLKELINKKTRKFVFKCEFVTFIETILIYEYELCFSFDENDEVFVEFESLKCKKNSSRNIANNCFVSRNGKLIEINASDADIEVINDKTKNLLSKQSTLYLLFKLISSNSISVNERMVFVYAVIFFLLIFTHFNYEDKHENYFQRIKLNEIKQKHIPLDSIIEEYRSSISTDERNIPIDEFDSYKKEIVGLEKFIKLFKPSLIEIIVDKRINGDSYNCRLLMNYGNYTIDLEFESAGIKHLIEMYNALKLASMGAVVFIDELDANINDVMLGKLIEFFNYYGDGQLCFTTHNTEPMNVLKNNSKSIDYLTSDNRIVSWVKNGHYSPENCYRSGMIEGIPFNVDPSDFVSAFEVEE